MDDRGTLRDLHLVGSVPLASADAVFRAASELLGARLARIPDGETGRRKNWINFQYAVLAANPALDFAGPAIDLEAFTLESDGMGADYAFTKLRLRDGAVVSELGFHGLGYAAHAIDSYARFAELKRTGVIRPETRFQISLPTPLAPVAVFVVPEQIFMIYPYYARALLAELDEVMAAIPHDQIAVQWDVAIEIGVWEGLFPRPPGDWKAMLLGQLAQLGTSIPADVPFGYHLCYGDRGHKHFVEPKDTTNLTEIANGLVARVSRPIDWFHFPVPRDRDDDAYFAPLAALRLAPATKLFLGLVHLTDGVSGARRRIATAARVVPDFGIATECGLGRRRGETILDLLRLHAAIE